MKHLKIYATVVAIAVISLITGCTSKKTDLLTTTQWKLIQMNGMGVENPDDEFTLKFETADSTIHVTGACNRFFGKYTVDGATIDLSVDGATMMFCQNLKAEQAFFKILDTADKYSIMENGNLILFEGETKLAEFEPWAYDAHNAEDSLDYEGTYKGTIPSVDCPGIDATVVIDQDGTYTSKMIYLERGAVFNEQGKYTIEGNIITMDDTHHTTLYKVEENAIRLLNPEGNVIGGDLADKYVLSKQ